MGPQQARRLLLTVDALLFDLGGVVIRIDFARAVAFWADRCDVEPEMLARRFTFDLAYQQHERGELTASEYLASLRRSLQVDLSDDDLLTGWNDIYLGLVPGVVEMLHIAAQHYPLFAFTNSNQSHHAVWSIRFVEALSVFQSVFVSSELGLRKPDVAAFETVAGRIGVPPGRILFFDDLEENVTGARRAGLETVLVRSSVDVREALERLGIPTPEGPDERTAPG